jgi:uncharacterized protein involved in outer membrane biogenesis
MPQDPSPTGQSPGWRDKLRLQGWRLWAVIAVAAYTLIGFLLLPWIARDQVPKFARESLGLDVSIEKVRFNPYLFTVSVEGLSAVDPEMGPVLRFSRLFVDFELSSLWNMAWTFAEIRFEHPHASVTRFADGETNLQKILDRMPEPPDAEPDPNAPPPRLIIRAVSLTDGEARLEDRTRPTPWSVDLGPVSFSLTGFGTLSGQQGTYEFNAVNRRGGRILWNGSLAVAPLRSSGTLGLRNLDVVTLWSYLSDDYDADISEARLNLSFGYELDASGDDLRFALSDGNVDVADLVVARRSSGEELISLPQLSAAGIDFDLQALDLGIGAVEILGAAAQVRRLEDGSIDLAAAFAPADASSGEPEAAAPPREDDAAPGGPTGQELTVRIDNVSLRDGRATFEDRAAPRPVTLSAEAISLDISDYASTEGHRANVGFSASLASGGVVSAGGRVRAEPLQVGMDVEAGDVSLMPLLPYADGTSNLQVESIAAGLTGRVTITPEEPFGFEGNLTTRDFSSHLGDETNKLITWKRLDADRVRVSLAGNSVRIGQATLGQPFIRIRISEAGDFNLSKIAVAGADAGQETPAGEEETAPLAIGVGRVQIIQGKMDFEDLGLPLPFRALVESMQGSVSAITSGSPTPARVEIDGDVNEYGAATIRGTLDIFDPVRLMDLEVDFRNVEMPDLTPYSAKFAGRKIDEGRLDVDLNWSIRDSQLEASNRMVIEDLVLGEEVESPGAMNLPLDLAVALLTDTEGRIDLDVPVTGDLDNPEFGYASLVFKALGNLLGKIVTAPFRFLASLVGGDGVSDADLEFVGFVAGESKLLGPEQEDLDKLAAAMGQRPELALRVGAAYDPDRDAAAIRQQRLDAKVSERFELTEARDDGRDPVRAVLEDLYTESGGPEALQALVEAHSPVPEGKDAPVLDEAAYLTALRNALLDAEPVSPQDLEVLASERARTVQGHLVNSAGLDAARVATGAPAEAGRADDNLVFLKLDVAVD